jgi:hypothetical protein
MNNDKFDQWQDEIRSVKIDGLDDSIRRKIEKQKREFHLRILKTASAFVLTLFIAFALLVNLSPEFYTFAYNNKIIGPIAEMLKYSNRKDTRSAFDLNYAQEVDIKLASGYYELDTTQRSNYWMKTAKPWVWEGAWRLARITYG